MLRGRHRGLPVAIDRAVLLPSEFRDRSTSELGNDTSPEDGTGPEVDGADITPADEDSSSRDNNGDLLNEKGKHNSVREQDERTSDNY